MLDYSSKYSDIVKKTQTDYERIKAKYTPPVIKEAEQDYAIVAGTKYPWVGKDDFQQSAAPSETTYFADLGEGKFAVDPKQGGTAQMIKSGRAFDPVQNMFLRKGKPSWSHEIDHTVPLWLGGSDTMDNKEVLSISDHDRKTKANAVVMSLYYNDKISINTARSMAMNWQDTDVSGIETDEKGQTDMTTALRKYAEWQKPKKVSAKEWGQEFLGTLKNLPRTAEALIGGTAVTGASAVADAFIPGNKYDSLKEGIKYGKEVLQGKQGLLADSPEFGGLTEGVYEGATLGHLAPEVREFGSEEEMRRYQMARMVGSTAGGLLGFMGGMRAVGGVTSKLLGTKIGAATKIPAIINSLKKSEEAYKLGKIVLPKSRALEIMANSLGFGVVGQLSKQEEEGFKARAKSFVLDASMGSLFSVAGHTSKGFSQHAKSYGGLAAGVWALSAIEGATPAEALQNTIFMVGLHGVGRIGHAKKIEALGNRFAQRKLAQFGVRVQEGVPYTQEQWLNDRQIIQRNIQNNVAVGEQADAYKQAIVSARQLYKGGLTQEQKFVEDWKDVRSMWDRSTKMTKAEVENKPSYIIDNREALELYTKNPKITVDLKDESVGHVVLTGTAENRTDSTGKILEDIAPETAKDIRALIDNGGGKRGDKVYGFIRDAETDPAFFEAMKKVPKKGFMGKIGMKRYVKPEANIQWVAFKDGETYNIGMQPTEEVIRFKNENKRQEFAPVNANMNNIKVYNDAKSKGYKVITGEVEFMGKEGTESKQPYSVIRITEDSWRTAPGLNEAYKAVSAKKAATSIAKANISTRPTGEVYSSKNIPQSEGAIFIQTPIEAWKRILDSKNATELQIRMTEEIGHTPSMEVAETLLKSKDTKKVGDIFRVLQAKHDQGALNEAGEALFQTSMGEGSFWKNMSPKERNRFADQYIYDIKELPINVEKTGQIDQKIELEKAPEKKVIEAVQRVQKEKTKINEAEEKELKENTKKAVEAVKERMKVRGVDKDGQVEGQEKLPLETAKVTNATKEAVKPEVPNTEKIDISGSKKKSPFFEKDKAKFSEANKLISRGSENSSSNAYAVAVGAKANPGEYKASDIVAISSEGNRKNRIKPDFVEIKKAIDAKSTVITDNKFNRNRDYNIGEREVANFLSQNNYKEVVEGTWKPQEKGMAIPEAKTETKIKVEPKTEIKTEPTVGREAAKDWKQEIDNLIDSGKSNQVQEVILGGKFAKRNNLKEEQILTYLKEKNWPNQEGYIESDISRVKKPEMALEGLVDMPTGEVIAKTPKSEISIQKEDVIVPEKVKAEAEEQIGKDFTNKDPFKRREYENLYRIVTADIDNMQHLHPKETPKQLFNRMTKEIETSEDILKSRLLSKEEKVKLEEQLVGYAKIHRDYLEKGEGASEAGYDGPIRIFNEADAIEIESAPFKPGIAKKGELLTEGKERPKHIIARSLEKASEGDSNAAKVHKAIMNKLDKNFYGKMSKETGIKSAWKHVKIDDVKMLKNKTINQLFTRLSTQKLKFMPEFVDYSAAINGEVYTDLPLVLQKRVAEIKKKYPNTQIKVLVTDQQSKNPYKYYNMFEDVRLEVNSKSGKEDLHDVGRDFETLTTEQQKNAEKAWATGKNDYHSKDVLEDLERLWMGRSSPIGETRKKSTSAGDLEVDSGLGSESAIEAGELISQMQIKNRMDMEEVEYNNYTWAMEPALRYEKLSDKAIDNIADGIMIMFKNEIDRAAQIAHPQGSKTTIGGVPVGILALLAIAGFATQGKSKSEQPQL